MRAAGIFSAVKNNQKAPKSEGFNTKE